MKYVYIILAAFLATPILLLLSWLLFSASAILAGLACAVFPLTVLILVAKPLLTLVNKLKP